MDDKELGPKTFPYPLRCGHLWGRVSIKIWHFPLPVLNVSFILGLVFLTERWTSGNIRSPKPIRGHGLLQLEASPGGLHRVWLAVSKSYSALMVMTLKITMEMGVGLERGPGWRSLGPG